MIRFAVLALVINGCVPSRRELREPVDLEIARRFGTALDSRAKIDIDGLLAKPLERDAAIKIAIANNARLAAAFDELGIAGGRVASAMGLGSTEVHAAVRWASDHTQVEVDVIQNVLGLITGGARRTAARAELDAVRAQAAAATLRLAARVEIAFTDLLAAQQALELRRTAFESSDAAATLRERMHAAGNTTDLAQARERDAREQARIALARAEVAVELRRSAVDTLLGLTGERTKWTATGTLAAVPAAAPSLDALEATAVAASLELEAGRARVHASANHVRATRLRAVLPTLGVGVSVHYDGHANGVGPVVAIGIPLFDPGSGERATAKAAAARAGHELTATAVELRAAARSARITALAAYQEARHIQAIVLPLRQQIVDETLKHYNAMDADPFALLAARRDLVDAGDQYLDALRRYTNAMTSVTALERGVTIDLVLDVAPTQMSTPPSAQRHH